MDILFRISTWDLLLSLFSAIFFSYVFWRNSKAANFKKSVVWLELLRIVIVIMIILTLFEPEYIKKEKKLDKSEVVILYDNTGSMKTKDVTKGATIISREDELKRILDKDVFKNLKKNFLVHYENFSGKDKKDFSDISTALKRTLAKYQNLQYVFLLSDGDWNKGKDPTEEALYFGTQGVKINTLTLGNSFFLKDIVLTDIKAPAFSLVKENTIINYELKNHYDHDITTKILLRSNNQIIKEQNILIPAQESLKEKILWKPLVAGNYKLVVETPVLENEDVKNNNKKELSIVVREELLSVLVIDSEPRWEYRYLRNALYRDPKVKVSTYLFHDTNVELSKSKGYLKSLPTTIQGWAKYDVVFLGDIGINQRKGITKEQAELLKGLVSKQGSGLVFLPGSYGRQLDFIDSPLGDLLPVNYDETKNQGVIYNSPSRISLTSLGENHLLTLLNDRGQSNTRLWKKLPGFYWSASVKSAKRGSRVLAVHASHKTASGQNMPLLVTNSYGSGNILYLGTDNAWKWRKGVEDKYHYRFWGQVVRWMAHKRHIASGDGGRVSFLPERPIVGENVKIEATLFDLSNTPIANGDVVVSIRDHKNSERLFPLKELEGGWGVYEGFFRPEVGGTYKIQVTEKNSQRGIKANFEVLDDLLEKQGQPANSKVMKEIALLSKGNFIEAKDLNNVVFNLNEVAENFNEYRVRIWKGWWWVTLLTSLFSIYWILRKKFGFI